MAARPKRLTPADLARSALAGAVRHGATVAREGRLPTFQEVIEEAGKTAAGALLQAQGEAEEQAPDTDRTPTINAEGWEA